MRRKTKILCTWMLFLGREIGGASRPDDKGRRVERVAVPVGRARVVVRHSEVAVRPRGLGGPTGVGEPDRQRVVQNR